MKKIETKNYIYLAILIVGTILLTLFISYIYINKDKDVSTFYDNSNKITAKELDSYLIENEDSIIYIDSKYNVENEVFENKFEQKLTELNLKDKFVYLDKETLSKKDINKLEKKYNINISLDKCPAVLLLTDKKIEEVEYVNNDTNVDNFIDYGAFE